MSAQDIFLHVAHLSLSIVPLKSILVVCIHRSQLHHVRLFVIPWTSARQASLSITNSQSLLRLMFIESVMPSNHLIPCCLLLSCLKSFPASGSSPPSQLFTSGGQSTGASSSVPPVNIQDWFLLGWAGRSAASNKRRPRCWTGVWEGTTQPLTATPGHLPHSH